MLSILEAFGLEFVDIFRARRACSKPAARRDDLQTADRGVVAGSAGKFRGDRLTGQFGGVTSSGESFLSRFFCSGVAGASMRV